MNSPHKQNHSLEKDHPLQSRWTFWYEKPPNGTRNDINGHIRENLQNLGTVKTLYNFFHTRSFLHNIDHFVLNSSFCLFRGTALPIWKIFPNGGCWMLKIKKKSALLNTLWEKLMLAVIGEYFETTEIVGLSFSNREEYNAISIWIRKGCDLEMKDKVATKFRALLELGEIPEFLEYTLNIASLYNES